MPSWVQDPFLAAGVSTAPSLGLSLLQGRYLPIAPIHQSPGGIVYEAVDLKQERRCVLKCAYRDASLDDHLRDARDILRNEAHILAKLVAVPSVPRMYGFFEDDDNAWLAMEYIEGMVLDRHIRTLVGRGENLPIATLTTWIQDLAEVCASIHQHHIMYRDIKAVNDCYTGREAAPH